MAIIVSHKESGQKFVLIGTGYGLYKSVTPGFFGGNLFPNEESGEMQVVAVSDRQGNILWFSSEEIRVIEVDGKVITALFADLKHSDGLSPTTMGRRGDEAGERDIEQDQHQEQKQEPERCPACGFMVSITAKECPSCGLLLSNQE